MPAVDLDALMAGIRPLLTNRLRNYIVPGLTSYLVGNNQKSAGQVRMFFAERETLEFITPHSHRFDFTCLVLSGSVENTVFERVAAPHSEDWCLSSINQVCGTDGLNKYEHVRDPEPTRWCHLTTLYEPGQTYSMTHKQLHSIQFATDTRVLFFEGPELTSTSHMIEPWCDGKVIPTFRTEAWMFEKDAA